MDVFKNLEPDGVLSAADVKEAAADVIQQLPMGGIEGSPLDSDDIWPVVTMASVNQTSVWEVTSQTDDTPCDDTVLNWLHTLQRDQLEMAANILLRQLALTILDPDRSRIVSIDFVDNPYHGSPNEDSGELCTTSPTDGSRRKAVQSSPPLAETDTPHCRVS